ncbi:YitT family protein [Peribacillus kribbensis]|uniref:YitT family protein n=1 Tax=Peribacillus kribbensis TaxID=356658 RepID=UPI000413A74F|nr:YitT family protein [Peribacillus kribbensis]
MIYAETKKIGVVIIGAFLNAISMNLFLIPAKVYASGFTGLAQLLSNLLGSFAPFKISTGILLLILNIPVAVLAWKKVGKLFTFYSLLSVGFSTIFLETIPVKEVSPDILLNAVFGGVIAAVGIGLTLKYGASTGGLDIVAMVLSRLKDKPIGIYMFSLNALIILTAGYVYGWEKALYTLVALYASTRVVDAIHTRYEKLTVMIITKNYEEMKSAIYSKFVRGLTLIPAKGAFKNEDKNMIMIVITRYELYDLEKLIKEVDPASFTNIVETVGILGQFRKD